VAIVLSQGIKLFDLFS